MSSKKKQVVSAADKKKFSLFNLRKTKGSTGEKSEPSAAAAEIIDTAMTAAVLHSDETEKPSTSANKGQIKKLAKFFKKGNSNTTAHPRKVPKKANVAATDRQQKKAENEETAITVEKTKSGEIKADGSEPGDTELKLEKAATKIQAVFRGHNERRKYKQKRQNIIKIEALTRGFLARKQVASMKMPITTSDATSPAAAQKKENVNEVHSENLISL